VVVGSHRTDASGNDASQLLFAAPELMKGGFHGNALYRFQGGNYADVTATSSPISATDYTQGSLYLPTSTATAGRTS
jgi:hypothetical protein